MFLLFGEPKLVNTQEIPLDTLQRISIDYIFENIFIREAAGDKVIVREYFTQQGKELFAKITTDQDGLTIRHGERRKVLSYLTGYVEIYLPKAFYGTLNIKSISGKVQVEAKLALNELVISNTSGKIYLEDVMAGTAVLYTVSGGISAGRLCAYLDAQSTSGSIRIAHAEGQGTYKSVSGTIEAAYQSVTGDITARSTSGRLRIRVPETYSFYVDMNTISGGMIVPTNAALEGSQRSKAGARGTSPQSTIRMSTISGRIELLATE